MCIRDRGIGPGLDFDENEDRAVAGDDVDFSPAVAVSAVSYTHIRAHETVLEFVCRLLPDINNTKSMVSPINPRLPPTINSFE